MTIFDKAEQWLDEKLEQLKKLMNRIIIDDEPFDVNGSHVVVRNRQVIVNGKVIKNIQAGKNDVKIVFEGDLASLDCTQAVINGNVHGDVDGTTLTINGNVRGNVDGTNVRCGDVGKNVDATSVNCGNIKGNVDALNVKRNR